MATKDPTPIQLDDDAVDRIATRLAEKLRRDRRGLARREQVERHLGVKKSMLYRLIGAGILHEPLKVPLVDDQGQDSKRVTLFWEWEWVEAAADALRRRAKNDVNEPDALAS